MAINISKTKSFTHLSSNPSKSLSLIPLSTVSADSFNRVVSSVRLGFSTMDDSRVFVKDVERVIVKAVVPDNKKGDSHSAAEANLSFFPPHQGSDKGPDYQIASSSDFEGLC